MRRGRWQRTRVPPPSRLSISTQPSCSSRKRLTSARPRPAPARAPARLLAEKRSNTLAITSGGRPGPLSATAICTSSATIFADSTMLPPRGVYLKALDKRLNTTCRRRRASARNSPASGGTSTSRVSPILPAHSPPHPPLTHPSLPLPLSPVSHPPLSPNASPQPLSAPLARDDGPDI